LPNQINTYKNRQFFLIIVASNAFIYLRNFELPRDFIAYSGHKNLKRKPGEIETLIYGASNSWLKIINSTFLITSPDLLDIFKHKEILGDFSCIPYIQGELKKDYIEIYRDPLGFHPLYFGRLPDGFIFAPRKEWIQKVGSSPDKINPNVKIFCDFYSIKFERHTIHPKENASATPKKAVNRCINTVIKNLHKDSMISIINFVNSIETLIITRYFVERGIKNIEIIYPYTSEGVSRELKKAINSLNMNIPIRYLKFKISRSIISALSELIERSPFQQMIFSVPLYLIRREFMNSIKRLIIYPLLYGLRAPIENSILSEILETEFKSFWPNYFINPFLCDTQQQLNYIVRNPDEYLLRLWTDASLPEKFYYHLKDIDIRTFNDHIRLLNL